MVRAGMGRVGAARAATVYDFSPVAGSGLRSVAMPRAVSAPVPAEVAGRMGLEARLAALAPDATLRGLFFNAVLAMAEGELGAEVAGRMRAQLALPTLDDVHVHAARDYLRLVDAVAWALAPRVGGYAEGLRWCGRAAMGAFERHSLGALVRNIVGPTGGPHHLFAAAGSGLRAVANFGHWAMVPTGASSLLLQVREDPLPPALYEGGFRASLLSRMGRRVEVLARPLSVTECDYIISWLDPRASPGTSDD